MSWIELSLDTTNEAVDWVCTLLAKAIAAEDMHIHEYRDRSSNHSPEDHLEHNSQWTYTIQIYLLENAQIHQRIEAIAKILTPLHRTGMTSELQTFIVDQKPVISPTSSCEHSLIRRIGDRFVVIESKSCDLPEYQVQNSQEIPLYLQNSLAFGSGLHPATVLSLRLLERHLQPNMSSLDLGSGSGILSVAMAKLGAKVLAIDNDRIAVAATQDAVERNRVSDQVTVTCGSLGSASELGHWMGGDTVDDDVPAIAANGEFDLIVANIFARVHISLAHDFCQALRSDAGILITAGYTSERETDLINAMSEAGLTVCDRAQIDEWLAIAFQKFLVSN